jgi:hypothetical protein
LIANDAERTDYCEYDPTVLALTECQGFINNDTFIAAINSCSGQSECVVQNVSQYFNQDPNNTNNEKCFGKGSNMFVQVGCSFPVDQMNKRQLEGLYIGCMGVFIALFFVVFVDYISSVFKNSFVEWDVKTVTAGDYSCELDISEAMW